MTDAVAKDATASETAVLLQDVRKDFGSVQIIRGASLAVTRGERHAVIGPNGAGKSTLFNLISGRLDASSGHIAVKGHDIAGLRPFEICRLGLSRSFQVTNIFARLSVYENLRVPVLWALGLRYAFWRFVDNQVAVRERTEQIMEEIGLTERRHVAAGALTYAEQRALEIGITIASGADVVLLDEPTAGMSRSETAHAVALIRRISEGRTLLIIEHDMGVVFDLADRISVLVYGEVIASDTPAAVRANAQVQEAYLGVVPHVAAGTRA